MKDPEYVEKVLEQPSLDVDLSSLLLDLRFLSIELDHVANWVTVEEFIERYSGVFDEPELSHGIELLTAAAEHSVPFIIANKSEFAPQMYSRLIQYVDKYDVIFRYLQSLLQQCSGDILLLPTKSHWPDVNGPEKFRIHHKSEITSVSLSYDGETIVFGSSDCNVYLYSKKYAKVVRVLQGHTQEVTCTAVAADNRWAASGSTDGSVRLWDMSPLVTSEASNQVLHGHSGQINSVAISTDGKYVVSASEDETVRLWDNSMDTGTGGKYPRVLRIPLSNLNNVAISGDGQRVTLATSDGSIRLWNTVENEDSSHHNQWLSGNCATVTKDGAWVLYGSEDRKVRLGIIRGADISSQILHKHSDPVASVAISDDGQIAVSASCHGDIKLWNNSAIISTSSSEPFYSDRCFLNNLTISGDGQWLAALYSDNSIRVLNTSPSLQFSTPKEEKDRYHVNSIAVSHDRRWIVAGCDDHTLKLWDTNHITDSPTILQGHTLWIKCVAISDNGQWIVSSSADQTIRMWDMADPDSKFNFRVLHSDESCQNQFVNCIDISGNGEVIASGFSNHSVKVWQRSNKKINTSVLFGHAESVNTVSVNRGGKWIATASLDCTVRLWYNGSGSITLSIIIALSMPVDSISILGSHNLAMKIETKEKTFSVSWKCVNSMSNSLYTFKTEGLLALSEKSYTAVRGLKNFYIEHYVLGHNYRCEELDQDQVAKFKKADTIPFGQFIQRLQHRLEMDNQTSAETDADKSSLSGSVQIYLDDIYHNSVDSPAMPTEITSDLFYCRGRFVYDSITDKQIVTLPAPVLSLPNALSYSLANRTLSVFCVDYNVYFFTHFEQPEYWGVDKFMEFRNRKYCTDFSSPSTESLDQYLFNCFKQSSQKIRMINRIQALDRFSDGVFIHIGDKHVEIPDRKDISTTYEINCEFEDDESDDDNEDDESIEKEDASFTVMFDIDSITPLGISVLFWILPFSEQNAELLKAMLAHRRFRNCLSKQLTGAEWHPSSKETSLVIPMTWTYYYDIDEEFLIEHSKYGSFGISIATTNSSNKAPSKIQNIIPRFREQDPSTRVMRGAVPHARFNEFLMMSAVKEENEASRLEARLFYFLVPKKRLKSKLITKIQTPFVEVKFTAEGNQLHKELMKKVRGSSGIKILSIRNLAQIGMSSTYDNLYDRLNWLNMFLSHHGVYPNGHNRRFLEIFAESCDSNAFLGEPIDLFPRPDCKLLRGHLNKGNCKQYDDPENQTTHIILPEKSTGKLHSFTGTKTESEEGNVLLAETKSNICSNPSYRDAMSTVNFDLA